VGDTDTAICSLRYRRLMQDYACLGKHLVGQRTIACRVGEAGEAVATNASRKGQHRVDLL
jgi:hypothetical protein